jgi:hypothetical protein
MAKSMMAVGAVVLALGCPVAVLAASADEATTRMAFEAADRDGDGQVTEAEIVADMAAAFNALDTNRDRTLEPGELPRPDPEGFRQSDTNGDGRLTFTEAVEAKLKQLAPFDANDDRQYSLVEIRRYDESR